MMGIVSDHLDQDRFTILHKRAERAFLARHNSRTIFKTLQVTKFLNFAQLFAGNLIV